MFGKLGEINLASHNALPAHFPTMEIPSMASGSCQKMIPPGNETLNKHIRGSNKACRKQYRMAAAFSCRGKAAAIFWPRPHPKSHPILCPFSLLKHLINEKFCVGEGQRPYRSSPHVASFSFVAFPLSSRATISYASLRLVKWIVLDLLIN